MQIIEPTKDQLNNFVLQSNGSFQQSYEWGELQESMGRRTKRFLITDNHNRAVASALFVRHDLPLGKYYWMCPRGPVVRKSEVGSRSSDSGSQSPVSAIRHLTSDIRLLQSGIFIRIEPEFANSELLTSNSWRKAPHDHNPRATILIDLEKDEDTLLAEMHPKARYNIRLAEKKGIRTTPSFNSSPLEGEEGWGGTAFLDLLKKTAGRDEFHLHPMEYYEKLLRLPFVELFSAYVPPLNSKRGEGGVIAGAIVAIFGNRATYLHGASDYEHRKLMAPHLLHWEVIRQLKARGLKYYDLGGVSPKDEPIPGWEGLTRFKQGFGGEYYETPGSWDFVLSKGWYMIYKVARKIL